MRHPYPYPFPYPSYPLTHPYPLAQPLPLTRCATLALLPVFQHALPALPISIAAGTAMYFIATLLVAPLAEFAAANSVLL